MSHGVHAVQHEVEHKIEHDKHGGGHDESGGKNINKRVALLIAVLALFLSFSETLGKSAQTAALNYQIEASNLWNFFQAKNIRRTATIIAAEQTKLGLPAVTDAEQKAAIQKQVDDWTKTAQRYRSEPETGEGTEQLAEKAKHAEHERDEATAKYHHFELASAAFQIGIVLASATIITGMIALAYVGGILTLAGLLMTALGLWWPHLVHLH